MALDIIRHWALIIFPCTLGLFVAFSVRKKRPTQKPAFETTPSTIFIPLQQSLAYTDFTVDEFLPTWFHERAGLDLIPAIAEYRLKARRNAISGASRYTSSHWPYGGTDEQKDDFMIRACNNLTPNENIIPAWARQDDAYASAKTAALGNYRIRLGMDEICGCTILFVLSRKRVYIAHYWENGLFGWNQGEKRRKLDFESQVLGFITDGYQPPNGPPQDSLQMHAEDFKHDRSLIVEVFSPVAQVDERPWGAQAGSTRNQLGLLYPAKVQRIAQVTAKVLGISTKIVGINGYQAVDRGDLDDHESFGHRLLKETAAGHVIFDYDPDGIANAANKWSLIWEREELLRG